MVVRDDKRKPVGLLIKYLQTLMWIDRKKLKAWVVGRKNFLTVALNKKSRKSNYEAKDHVTWKFFVYY